MMHSASFLCIFFLILNSKLQNCLWEESNFLKLFTQLEIPLEKVISITREKLALFIPNAIGIQVADQKVCSYVFLEYGDLFFYEKDNDIV